MDGVHGGRGTGEALGARSMNKKEADQPQRYTEHTGAGSAAVRGLMLNIVKLVF